MCVQSEFGEGDADGILLEAEAWNDEVITDLQERLHSSGASGSGQHEEEADGQPGPNDRQGGRTKSNWKWQHCF